MRTRVISTLAVLLLAVVTLGAGDANQRFDKLGHKLMCRCGCNQILLECNHVGCSYSTKMIDQLRASLDRGDNDDLILQGFVQEYGATVLAAPTTSGFNIVAWIMPFATLLLGFWLAAALIRRWRVKAIAERAAFAAQGANPALAGFREQARRETEL